MVIHMSYEEAVQVMTLMSLPVDEENVITFINHCAEGIEIEELVIREALPLRRAPE